MQANLIQVGSLLECFLYTISTGLNIVLLCAYSGLFCKDNMDVSNEYTIVDDRMLKNHY